MKVRMSIMITPRHVRFMVIVLFVMMLYLYESVFVVLLHVGYCFTCVCSF
jgi:hypothetical protein